MTESESQRDDRLLRALSTDTRRQVVRELASREVEEVTVSALVGPNGRMATSERVALYHRHLPKLQEAEIVTWDRETGRIRAGPTHEAAVALLETLEEIRGATMSDGP